MENVLYNIGQVLGITIIHSLWQGLFIYFVLRLALMFSAQLSSSKKYWFAVTSLVAITAWFVYTLVNEIHIYNWLAVAPAKLSAMPLMLELPASISKFNDQSIRYYYSIENYLPYITALYVAGLLFNISRLIMGRKKINTIRQTMSIDVQLQKQLDKFTDMLNIDYKVRIGLSKLVDVPCMVGYIKPVILLPFTLSTYLGAEEIEAILLHELAHIKRNDYLVNLLQQVLSTLLFFNPCAQLINRIINEERENCCDDLVVQITPNPVIYAKALLKLEQTRENNMRMAMAATGKKYQLLNRIERIMKTKKPTQSIRPALLAMLILTIGIGSIALLNPEIAQGKISVKAIVPAFTNLLTDTVKKTEAKKTAHLQAHTGKTHVHTTVHKNDVYFDSEGEDKREMELNAEIQKHADAISKFYNSGEFKNAQQQLEQKGKEMQAFYDRPELKRMQEEMNRVSANFSKTWSNNDNDKASKLSLQMGEKGNAIGAYYSSPGFKKMNRELKAKYGIPQDQEYFDDRNNENYKKYQEELSSRIPASVKQTQDDLKNMGEQIRKHYDSPEYKAQSNQLRELGDSIKNAYHNPAIQQQREEMRKLSEQMRAYQNSPEIKRQQELLKESVKKLTAYVNSPAFKNYVRRMKSYSYNYNFDDNIDRPERPEKPEKPERPEKMQKEAPEKPEAPETPPVSPANAPTPPAPPAD